MKDALIARFRERFGHDPVAVARAPGRIEFIGNHTDYNGGTVLGASIDRNVWVAIAPRSDAKWRFASESKAGVVEVAVGVPSKQTGEASWTNYPLGVIAAFSEFGLRMPDGFDFFAWSDLPPGAGLSSSAALELASGLCFLARSSQTAPRETLVKLCRHAENHFVGVPCGILDQGVSGFGRKDHLVFIDCRGPSFDTVPLPATARFWVFNTHTKHALVDGFYAARHRECMDAARRLGVACLADISPDELARREPELPSVNFKRAQHIVNEIARVNATRGALRAGDLRAVGQLLTQSHRSSQRLFENSTRELDFLVDRLCGARNVLGARLTGGGFGGAVMALTTPDFSRADADAIVAAYRREFGTAVDPLPARTGDGASLE